MADSGMKELLTVGAVAVGGYFLYQWFTSQTPVTAPAAGAPPGTTPAMNQGQGTTNISTTPSSTPQNPTLLQTVANNMTASLGQQTAGADLWDVAFTRVMGQSVDAKYGFNFDQVYGPTVNGVRNNGATMTALMFLQLAAQAVPGGLPGLSGLGSAMVRYPGMLPQMQGNMTFQANHPLPYALTYTLKGLGAFTQPTGFERALFAGGKISRDGRVLR